MSWQSWVDNLLAYPPVNVAGIYGLDGSVWAQSASCTATDAEIRALIAGLDAANAGEFSSFTFMGVKFMTLNLMNGEALGKCKYDSITAIKSKQCVIVGASMNPAEASTSDSSKVNIAVSKVKNALSALDY